MAEAGEVNARARTPPAGAGTRNGVLDVLRVFAALAVVAYHWSGERAAVRWAFSQDPEVLFPSIHEVTKYGGFGVVLFFVISGAVISKSALNRSSREFLAARAGRLVPSLAVSSALVAILVVFSKYSIVSGLKYDEILGGALLFNYVHKTPDLSGVYWTLFYEVKFYVLVAAGLAVLGGFTVRGLRAAAVGWSAVLILGATSLSGFPAEMLMLDYGPFFAAGMLIGLADTADERRPAAVLLVLLGVFVVSRPGPPVIPDAISAGSIALVALACWGPHVRALDTRAVVVLGQMTYPLYLLEGAPSLDLLRYLTAHGVGRNAALAVAFAFVVGASYLITRFVDPPAGRSIRRWIGPPRATPRPVPEP